MPLRSSILFPEDKLGDTFLLGGKEFHNRLFTGTGKFARPGLIPQMLAASGSEMITVALRRVNFDAREENILNYVPKTAVLLPNTSGARNAGEAVRIAHLARESGCGDFIKIEVIHEMKYLMPDNEETLKATEILAREGFHVLPYVLPDPVMARRLEDAGAAAVMPLGSPIGSNRGIRTIDLIEMVIESVKVPVVVDAGIGRPSHAAEAMEIGASAVLVNTAIATADDPVSMGEAFSLAVKAGRMARLAKLREERKIAEASSPLTGFLR
jgi:thiazole synthase